MSLLTLSLVPLALSLALASCTKRTDGVVVDKNTEEGALNAVHPGVKRLLILMYHDVRDCLDTVNHAADSLANDDVCLSNFTEQMKWLKSNGFTFISAFDLFNARANSTPLPGKSVLVTFDDNYFGTTHYAVPVLRAEKAKATVFVHTGFVPKEAPEWTKRMEEAETDSQRQAVLAEWRADDTAAAFKVYREGGHPKASWRAIVEAETQDRGDTIRYESHTVSHVDLSKLPPATVKSELEDSKAELESNFQRMLRLLGKGTYESLIDGGKFVAGGNKQVAIIAYPFGGLSSAVVRASRAAGYRLGFEVGFQEDFSDQSFTLPRQGIGQRVKTTAAFAALVKAYMDHIR